MSRRILPAAVLVLLLATLLRFHSLEVQSFWNDEGNSARLSERSVPLIIEGAASDIHPPVYYLALRGWREAVGETEFGLRAFSAFAGVLAVAVTLALGRILSPGHYAPTVMAGLLAAVSPALVYYSQETRMYSLLALWAVSSTWVWLVWLRTATGGRAGRGERAWGWLLAYGLLSAAGLYTHYFYPAVMLAQGVLISIWVMWPGPRADALVAGQRLRTALVWGGAVLGAVALYLPWVPIFVRQAGGREVARAQLLDFVAESGRWLTLGETVRPEQGAWALLAAVALVLLGLIAGRRRAIVPALMAIVPILFSYVAGTTDPAFFKFLLVAVPFLALLAGMAWNGRRWQLLAPAALTVVWLLGSLQSLEAMVNDPAFARADYRGVAARIAADGHPNAGIILNAPNQWEAFTYYHRDGAPVYPLPRGQADPAVLEPELASITANHNRLYALYWGEGQRDPERVVERWLDANAFTVIEEWVGDVRFVIYALPPAGDVATMPLDASFATPDEATITLSEAGIAPNHLRPGDVVQVALVWTTDHIVNRSYKVFLHLLDESGNLVAQRDSEPAAGSRPTTTWEPGERIEDKHGLLLPADLPLGRYELVIGLYDVLDPSARLTLTTDGATANSYSLGWIQLP